MNLSHATLCFNKILSTVSRSFEETLWLPPRRVGETDDTRDKRLSPKTVKIRWPWVRPMLTAFFLPCVTCLQGLKLCRDIIIRLCCCLGVKAIFSLPFQLMTVSCLLLSSLYNYLLWLRPVVKSLRTTSVLLYLLFSLFVRKDMYCVTANSELGCHLLRYPSLLHYSLGYRKPPRVCVRH